MLINSSQTIIIDFIFFLHIQYENLVNLVRKKKDNIHILKYGKPKFEEYLLNKGFKKPLICV